MKTSPFAKGFKTKPDSTSSEKRTALDRLTAIDQFVEPSTTLNTPLNLPNENESTEYQQWRFASQYTPGQIIELPLALIKQSPYNPRHFYIKSSITELAVNLTKQGQLQPIHVIPDYQEPGTFFVSDGGRRVRALKEANFETVKAIVLDLPIGLSSYKLGYDLNVQRDTQTVFDNAIVWKKFIEQKYFSNQKELADHLGLDESTIAVALSIAKLPEEIMYEMVGEPHHFGSNMAYQVGRYFHSKGAEATLRLIHKIIADDLSTRQVADLVKGRVSSDALNKNKGRQRYAHRLDIKIDGNHVGDLRSYSDDRLELKLKGLNKQKRDFFLEKIEQLFKEN